MRPQKLWKKRRCLVLVHLGQRQAASSQLHTAVDSDGACVRAKLGAHVGQAALV